MGFEAMVKRFEEYLSAARRDPARLDALKKNIERLLLIIMMLSIAFGASNSLFAALAAGALAVLLFVLNCRP